MRRFTCDVKQLKMNKSIIYLAIWQLIISTSNVTLEVPSLRLCTFFHRTTPVALSENKFMTVQLVVLLSATFLLVCFVCLKESTCKTKKNAFYFTLKALFFLEVIKF